MADGDQNLSWGCSCGRSTVYTYPYNFTYYPQNTSARTETLEETIRRFVREELANWVKDKDEQ